MTDERLRRWLDPLDEPLTPDPSFAATLFDALADELGHRTARTRRGTRTVPGAWSPQRRGRRFDLVLVAAIFVSAAVGVVAFGGATRQRVEPPVPPSDLLAEVRTAGAIRIAIRPDHPQAAIAGQAAAGFDDDVANEVARRLGLRNDIVILDVAQMLDPTAFPAWDVALPSRATWTIDTGAFAIGDVYYRWPHLLVVPAASTAASIDDLRGGTVCAVAADSGETWLRGRYGPVQASSIPVTILERASDQDCLATLDTGEAVAMVTAHLSAADVDVRADIHAIGGPDPEPRPVVVRRHSGAGPGSGSLLTAVDDALAAMRADGTLTRLSQNRFGGADLTAP